MVWEKLLTDKYVSANFDELHARIDNYQIYSILILDNIATAINTDHGYATALPSGLATRVINKKDINQARFDALPITNGNFKNYGVIEPRLIFDNDTQTNRYQNFLIEVTEETYSVPTPPTPPTIIDGIPYNLVTEQLNCIVYQSFSPISKINYNLSDVFEPYMSVFYNGKIRSDCIYFATGHPESPLLLPKQIEFVATSNRVIKWSYYRKNKLESHPKILHTLDYRESSLAVSAGKKYILPLIDPCLGTLQIDAMTKSEIVNQTQIGHYSGHYSVKFLFQENLQELCDMWDIYYPRDVPPINLASSFTVTVSGQLLPPLIYQTTRLVAIQNNYRLMAANNDVWGTGAVIASKNYPSSNHSIFQFNHQDFFETLQLDNSYGTYMTDSPRLIEIHTALSADLFSQNEIDANLPRVTTLGYLIKSIAKILGLRLNASGKLDLEDERKNFKPKTLNNPIDSQDASAYSINGFGTKGMYIQFMPTTYKDGKEEKLWDVVYDIPQLIQAKERALNAAIGIQHGSQIRVPNGDGGIRAYPNQLALLIDLSNNLTELLKTQNKMQIALATTGMEVRDLYSGLGIPVSTKFFDIKNSTNKYQIPYIGYQKDKPSILGHLTDLKINIGIINGVLMPKAQTKKTGVLNPFDVFK